jgi:hypothetical protein
VILASRYYFLHSMKKAFPDAAAFHAFRPELDYLMVWVNRHRPRELVVKHRSQEDRRESSFVVGLGKALAFPVSGGRQ